MKWNVDVLTVAKPSVTVGANVIRHLALKDGQLLVTFGKHSWATVDPQTGHSQFAGSD